MERPTLLKQIQAMLDNNKNDINNNMNSLKTDMNSLKADLNNFNDNVKSLQAESIAIRLEVLARIAARSRASSRALSSRHLGYNSSSHSTNCTQDISTMLISSRY